jgi:hypothetical protein
MRRGLLTSYCVSPECGAVFRDVNLKGAVSRLGATPDAERRSPGQPRARGRSTDR